MELGTPPRVEHTFDRLTVVTGDEQLAEAESRIATWLESTSPIDSNNDLQELARTIVILLLDVLDTEHHLLLSETGWRLEHSLRCRLAGTKRCVVEEPLRKWLREVGRPEEVPGRYVVGLSGLRKHRSGPVTLKRE